MSESRSDKDKKFWEVDEKIFRPTGIHSRVQRLIALLKSLTSAALISLLFAYPFLLVYVAIAYGGIAFWSSLTGSFVVVGIVLSKAGYSRNFRGAEGSIARRLASLVIAFVSIVGFYLGLFQFKLLMIPIFLGVFGAAMLVVVLRNRF